MSVVPLRERPAWKNLESHYEEIRERHLRELFAEDPARSERLSAEAVGIYLDYSKNRITDETIRLLLQLAEESRSCRVAAMPCSAASTSTSQRTGPSCTWRSGCRAEPRSWWTGSTSSKR